jgi:hypothetical protein
MRRISGLGASLISISLVLLAVGCGGGGGSGNGGSGNTNADITSISASCSPSSIHVNQTSTCSALVTGTGAFNPAVNWTASSGSIDGNGKYTATETAITATVTATSAQDMSKSATAQITVTRPNPVPFVNQPLVPMTAAPGGSSFALTVNGDGFVPGAVVNWNGNPLVTRFVNNSELTATVPQSDIAHANTASVTVLNLGGGTSNVQFFTVSDAVTAPTFTVDAPSFGNVVPTGGGLAVDINGDGKLDWVGPGASVQAGKQVCCELVVLLGNGDGSFQSPVAYPLPDNEFGSVAVGDFNGDGKLDVAVLGSGVSVFLGKGDGTFGAPIGSAAANSSGDVAVGDFNGDGELDLVATITTGNNQSQVSVLLGNGDGTFQTAVNYPIDAPTINGMVIGDFNGDGRLDIICATQFTGSSAELSVLLGFGDGTFATVRQIPMTYAALALVTADFNGDGKLDLVTTVDSLTGAISVFLGNGDGTFQDGIVYLTGGILNDGLIAEDFNNDGKLDLVVTNPGPPSNFILLFGAGDGTFPNGIVYSGISFFPISTGDFNGDGKLDLLGFGGTASAFTLLLQVNSQHQTGTVQWVRISTTND